MKKTIINAFRRMSERVIGNKAEINVRRKKNKFVSSPVCAAIVVSIHVYVLCVLNPIRDRPTLDIKRINFIG